MSAEELGEMTEEEKKDTLFACVQRWLESLPDLAEFPGNFEKAIKEMIDKEHNSIKKDGKKEDYEKEIKKLEDVCSNTYYNSLSYHLHRKGYGMTHLSRKMSMKKEVGILPFNLLLN